MKIRLGFVGNSSSSSFLIRMQKGPRKKDACPHCGRSGMTMEEAFEILAKDADDTMTLLSADKVIERILDSSCDFYTLEGIPESEVNDVKKLIDKWDVYKVRFDNSSVSAEEDEFGDLLNKLGVEGVRILDASGVGSLNDISEMFK